MNWKFAVSPGQPAGDVQVAHVTDALVTPFERGPLPQGGGPPNWMTGAVHDAAGRLVPESRREWTGDPFVPLATDPEFVAVPEKCRRLSGRWIYAGHWTNHFGHFLVEVVTNLWPSPSEVGAIGILAHRSYRGEVPSRPGKAGALKIPDLPQWQKDLLGLAGYGGLKVRIVRARPVRVDELVVPTRPVVLKSWAQPPAVELWRRIAAAVSQEGDTSTRLFFSRARHHAALAPGETSRVRTSPEWERRVEARCMAAGFKVIHPEDLPISRQIQLAKGADVIAGLSGSALHLSAFAPQRTKVLELGDARHPRERTPTQSLIDAALGHQVAFVPYRDEEALDAALRRC